MVGLSVHGSGGGGYLVLSRRVARATTTWSHASAPRWGETWARSIKIPRFLAVLGGQAYSLRPPWHVPGGPWVWSLGLFSFIFFFHIHKQKKSDWARSHNQVGIVHCLVELFLPFASSILRLNKLPPDVLNVFTYIGLDPQHVVFTLLFPSQLQN